MSDKRGVVILPADGRHHPIWLCLEGPFCLDDLKAALPFSKDQSSSTAIYLCAGRFELHVSTPDEYVEYNRAAHDFLDMLSVKPREEIVTDAIITGVGGTLLTEYMGKWILSRRF